MGTKQPDPLDALDDYRAEGASIGVPRGWVLLMLELHVELVEASPDLRYEQIKQKWGELRIYVSGATPEARDLITAAELRSRTVCEECGQPGSPCQRRGWYRALCTVHADVYGARAAGERTGKILAVRWEDVEHLDDTDRPATVTIAGTVGKKGQRKPIPKSEHGHRVLVLPEFGREALKRQRDRGYPFELVFPSAAGTPRWVNNVNRTWRDSRR